MAMIIGDLPPDSVIRAVKIRPAPDETSKNEIAVKIFVNKIAAHGTPSRFVTPKNHGALPERAMARIVRDATYSELLPAEMTESTMRPLIRCAAGRIPASVRAMVKGELAVLEPLLRRRSSL